MLLICVVSVAFDQLVQALQRQATSEGTAIRVYTIAYGSEANKDVLTQIASASGGKEYAGDPKQIEVDGTRAPAELVYGRRMSEELARIAPDASRC